MWSTSAGGHLMKVVNLTGFTVFTNMEAVQYLVVKANAYKRDRTFT